MKRRVLVLNDRYDAWSSYHTPFARLGDYTNNPKILEYAPEQVSCVVFTGGADVHPSFYNQSPCALTAPCPWRDEHEIAIFKQARDLELPLFGICRGAQLMCVMAGGTLCQHLTNHGFSDHVVETHDGQTKMLNSYHHQMMLPPEGAEVLAWAAPKLSRFYLGDGGDEIQVEREIEVCHFPNINALAVQYHPELHNEHEEGWSYYQELIDEFLYWIQYLRKEGSVPTMLQETA